MSVRFEDIPKTLRKYITEGIRKAFRYSQLYRDATTASRRVAPRFRKDGNLSKVLDVNHGCVMCGEVFKRKEINVDHIFPVVPPHLKLEDMTLDGYYCGVFTESLQVLCKPCHNRKTAVEKMIRKDLQEMSSGTDKQNSKRKVGRPKTKV